MFQGMAASSLAAFRALTKKKLDAKTWFEMTAIFDRAKPNEREELIQLATETFAQEPQPFAREMPLDWVKKLARGKSVPAARLVNALDLGNGLSLNQKNGFDKFFTLEEEELEPFFEAVGDQIEFLNYSDDVGEHPLHPGFLVDFEHASVLMELGHWKRVHTLRLNGWGISNYTAVIFKLVPECESLRELEMNGGDLGDSLEPKLLGDILNSQACAKLERLSLQHYWRLDAQTARFLVKIPVVQRLKTLQMGEVHSPAHEVLSQLQGVNVEMTLVD